MRTAYFPWIGLRGDPLRSDWRREATIARIIALFVPGKTADNASTIVKLFVGRHTGMSVDFSIG